MLNPDDPSPLPPHVVTRTGTWPVEVRRGSPADLHAADLTSPAGDGTLPTRRVVVQLVDSSAWVLGSTQSPEVLRSEVRAAATSGGTAVVVRRSGGGLVPLGVGAQVWIDLVVPSGDALWIDDVEAAAGWVGDAWVGALTHLGSVGGEVHRGSLTNRELGKVACFAATGPGEVVVNGRKVVGVSQRRTRHAARFQCMVPLRWEPAAAVSAFDPDVVGSDVLVRVADALEHRAGALPISPDGWSVVEALLVNLP